MGLLEITWWELVGVIGLFQSVSLLVFLTLRAGRIRNVSVSIACFLLVSVGFLVDFGTRYLQGIAAYPLLQDVVWLSIPVFFVLLTVQVAQVDGLPHLKYLWLLLLIPAFVLLGWGGGSLGAGCNLFSLCNVAERQTALQIASVLCGGLALLCLWARREQLDALLRQKSFKSDRYWLILASVFINTGLLAAALGRASGFIQPVAFLLIRDILACGLVYVASTSLLRIYPQTLKIAVKNPAPLHLTDNDTALIEKISDLIFVQKVYQETGYTRASLARELNISESVVTRLVNSHFGKSVPQLLNENRIRDAQRLLTQTTAPVSVIAEQVGFNSLPSFNRVFKEIAGVSPSDYRNVKA